MLPLMLSPYDLSSHAASVPVGVMLGDALVTMLPTPVDGDDLDSLRRAGDSSPMFLRLAESWRWTGPLWRAGLMQPGLNGARASTEMDAACSRIGTDPALAPLKPLIESAGTADSTERFNALCRDLLLGGSNPGVSVPLIAAIERFAATNALTLIRITPASLTGRLEREASRVALRVSLAAVVEAGLEDLLVVRESMSATLSALRAAVAHLVGLMRESVAPRDIAAAVEVHFEPARVEYERVLSERVSRLRVDDRATGQRIKIARISLTGSMVEAGASLHAAAKAARALARGPNGSPSTPPMGAPDQPSVALAPRSLSVLTVRPLRIDL